MKKIIILTLLWAAPAGAAPHAFYDRPGKILFAAAAGAAAFDAGQTCHNLANGGREYVLPTQHCAPAAAMLMGQVAMQELAAYGFHRLRWHKIERAVRLVTITLNTTGIVQSKRAGAW